MSEEKTRYTSMEQIPPDQRIDSRKKLFKATSIISGMSEVTEEGTVIVSFMAPVGVHIPAIMFMVERCPEKGVEGAVFIETRNGAQTRIPLLLQVGESLTPLGDKFIIGEGARVKAVIDTPCILWHALTYAVGV